MNKQNENLRLTLYIHGEMEATERLAFEAELESNPELKVELEALQNMDHDLNDLFSLNTEPEGLSSAQKEKVLESLNKPTPTRHSWPFYAIRLGSLAACLVLILMVVTKPEPVGATKSTVGESSKTLKGMVSSESVETNKNVQVEIADNFEEEADLDSVNEVEVRTLSRSDVKQISPSLNAPVMLTKDKSENSVCGVRGNDYKELNVDTMPESVSELRAFCGASEKIKMTKKIMVCPQVPIHRRIENKPNTESYAVVNESDFKSVGSDPLSTFSIDVDTASYSNVRRMLNSGYLPPKDAVRIEEFVNYFNYNYPEPKAGEPFSVNLEDAVCPWNQRHRIVRIGINSQKLLTENRPASNLVFLLDVSGSMDMPNKLPLLKKSMRLLIDNLGEKDRVAIVVYAGASGLVLPSTSCSNKVEILAALNSLSAGGSTNGGAGIELAYRTAVGNFIKGGTNRVILATDGDFNVGNSSRSGLIRMIEKYRKSGVFLSVLGFGQGNLKDDTMESLANKGNGNYAYIDSIKEAKKVLVNELGATLVTVAKDVKIQVEFNPNFVAKYRLIGYENRRLNNEDFANDKKDAGEIGAGHQVTALYEVVPVTPKNQVTKLKYQKSGSDNKSEILTVNIRYKKPSEEVSSKLSYVLESQRTLEIRRGSQDLRFASGVAAFGMLLRDSEHKGEINYQLIDQLCRGAIGKDSYRQEFLKLVEKAKRLENLK